MGGGAICLRGSCIFYDGNHDEYDSGPHKGAVCPVDTLHLYGGFMVFHGFWLVNIVFQGGFMVFPRFG